GYWWINDTNTGEKATGDDGKTPKFRIENGELQYSFNGKDWTSLGNIKGEPGMQGDSIFKENGVTVEGDHVIFTLTKALADGRETIELPLYSSALRFDSYETVNVTTAGKKLNLTLPDNLTAENYKCLIATVTPTSGNGVYTRA